jgi:two-component system, chemotaxis family, chemotaxis protein CheY
MKSIFLVDDSSTLRMSMAGVLSKAGFKVDEAADGDEALDKLKGWKPDLMITDLNMPNVDGITLITEARKLPGMKFVPMLMLTTESQQGKRDAAKAAGATGWLIKPVQPDALLQVIRQVLPGA